MSRTANMVSVSGGKDSQVTMLLALFSGAPNLHLVFADTGHEADSTYRQIEYLSEFSRLRGGPEVRTVKADFSVQIARKREFVRANWAADLTKGRPGLWVREAKTPEGTPPPAHDGPAFGSVAVGGFSWVPPIHPLSAEAAERRVLDCLEVLHPTGNPFLDLCLWKGRFPSTRRRFCSEQLKHVPLDAYVDKNLADFGTVISWQGVRADESLARAKLPMYEADFGSWEGTPTGHLIYRPIIDWTAPQVFDFLRAVGAKWDPLYDQGMGRVGCLPCIHATKDDMRALASRFPHEIEKIERWEHLVSRASKRGVSTFMDARVAARYTGLGTTLGEITPETHGIRAYVAWSRTKRGGKVLDELALEGHTGCASKYGTCEIRSKEL